MFWNVRSWNQDNWTTGCPSYICPSFILKWHSRTNEAAFFFCCDSDWCDQRWWKFLQWLGVGVKVFIAVCPVISPTRSWKTRRAHWLAFNRNVYPVSLRTCFMTSGMLSNYFIPRIRFSGMLRVVVSKLVTDVSEQHISCFFQFQAVQVEFFLNCYAVAITWNFSTLLRFSKFPFEIYFSSSNGHMKMTYVCCCTVMRHITTLRSAMDRI